MDLEYLTTFLEIAKQGSFSRAGQKLFRSQPAVSAQIRQLEEEYGQKLFDRVGKSMKLTAAGEVLLGYAGRLITLKNDSLRAVADQSSAHAARSRSVPTKQLASTSCPMSSPNSTDGFHPCRLAFIATSAER